MFIFFAHEIFTALGCILDDERAKLFAKVVDKGCAVRFAFAAAMFGDTSEALFWLQLPRAFNHLMKKLVNKPVHKAHVSMTGPELGDTSVLSRISSKEKVLPGTEKKDAFVSHFDSYCRSLLGLMYLFK